MCACVRARARACVRACVRVRVRACVRVKSIRSPAHRRGIIHGLPARLPDRQAARQAGRRWRWEGRSRGGGGSGNCGGGVGIGGGQGSRLYARVHALPRESKDGDPLSACYGIQSKQKTMIPCQPVPASLPATPFPLWGRRPPALWRSRANQKTMIPCPLLIQSSTPNPLPPPRFPPLCGKRQPSPPVPVHSL